MRHGGAVDLIRSRCHQSLGGAFQGGSRGADVVDKQHPLMIETATGGEAAATEGLPLTPAPSGLAGESVTPKDVNAGPVGPRRHLVCEQTGGAGAESEAPNAV